MKHYTIDEAAALIAATVHPGQETEYSVFMRRECERHYQQKIKDAVFTGELLFVHPIHGAIVTPDSLRVAFLPNGRISQEALHTWLKELGVEACFELDSAVDPGKQGRTQSGAQEEPDQHEPKRDDGRSTSGDSPAEAHEGLSRNAIRNLFSEISKTQWRGLFNRKEKNGLSDCLVITTGSESLYEPIKLARWIGNNRPEITLTDALRRVQDGMGGAQEGPSPTKPTAHDPFGLTKKKSR